MAINLTEHEAYEAMYAFLEQIYETTESNDIASLLGGMSFLPEGSTADPAVWSDWLECALRAKAGKVDANLKLDSDD